MKKFAPVFLRLAVLLLLSCGVAGCMASGGQKPSDGPVSLLIQGYNYTDDYIENFTVDGQGGGNVFEGGLNSVPGGGVCCIAYRPGTPFPIKLKVRWTASYCRYKKTNQYGETYERRRGLWKETEALILDPPKGVPSALELHFFPDGHVEAAITEGSSPPRMKRPLDADGGRPGVSHDYPWCTDEQR